MMKIFLILLTLGSCIALGLHLMHTGVISRPTEQSSEKPKEYIISPNIFLDIIGKDSNYVAGVFHNENFSRINKKELIEFHSMELGANQVVYVYKEMPSVYFYKFNEKSRADEFLDSIKSTKGSSTISINNNNNMSFKIGKCIFTTYGYRIDNEGYTFKICNSDSSLKSEVLVKPLSQNKKHPVDTEENKPVIDKSIVSRKKIITHVNDDDLLLQPVKKIPDYQIPEFFNGYRSYSYSDDKNNFLKIQIKDDRLNFAGKLGAHKVYGYIQNNGGKWKCKNKKFDMDFLFENEFKDLRCDILYYDGNDMELSFARLHLTD